MDKQFLISKAIEIIILGLSGFGIIKTINYFISRDRVRAEADKMRAEAEAERVKTYQELLKNVMEQLRDVRNENMQQIKEMHEMKLHHQKELDEERTSCANAMKLMSDQFNERITELQHQINELKK